MPMLKPSVLYFGDNLPILCDHIPDESVDLVCLDPPFNRNRNYFVFLKDRTGQARAGEFFVSRDCSYPMCHGVL